MVNSALECISHRQQVAFWFLGWQDLLVRGRQQRGKGGATSSLQGKEER